MGLYRVNIVFIYIHILDIDTNSVPYIFAPLRIEQVNGTEREILTLRKKEGLLWACIG